MVQSACVIQCLSTNFHPVHLHQEQCLLAGKRGVLLEIMSAKIEAEQVFERQRVIHNNQEQLCHLVIQATLEAFRLRLSWEQTLCTLGTSLCKAERLQM